MVDRNQLLKINGPDAVAALDAHRARQEALDSRTRAEKEALLGGVASQHSGMVPAAEAHRVAEQARANTGQHPTIDNTGGVPAVAIEQGGAHIAQDASTPGDSAFLPGTTIPLGEGGVTVNPNATPTQPEVRVNPPQGPTAL